jgi:hypothetical protein
MTEEAHHVTARELADLRKVCKMVLNLDEYDPGFKDLRALAQKALNYSTISKNEKLAKARAVAFATNAAEAIKRKQVILAQIDAIFEDAGVPLTYEQLARALDARGVKPFRASRWSAPSVRFVIRGRK